MPITDVLDPTGHARVAVVSALHPVHVADDPVVAQVTLAAARSMLRAESREDAAAVLQAAVVALGGVPTPAIDTVAGTVPTDVSLGTGPPLVVLPSDDAARARLLRALPGLVEDACAVAARCDRHTHEAWLASVDDLTGVSSRRVILPQVSAAGPGDAICIIDLDHLKQLNDATGHLAGDEALRTLGHLLRDSLRAGDFVGRYGGDEFVVVLAQTPQPVAVRRIREIAACWRDVTDGRLSLSAGVAIVGRAGGVAALELSDRALYRAKQRGRGRVEAAVPRRGDGTPC